MERDIERALITSVKKSGGLCLKFVSPGTDGVPDRLCLWPGGRMAFVEVKRPGGKPRPLQKARIKQLRSLGFPVEVIDRKEMVDPLIEKMSGGAAKSGGGADA